MGRRYTLDGRYRKLLTGGRPPYVKHDMSAAGYEAASGDEEVV